MSTVPAADRSLEQVLREKREQVLAIAERHGAFNVRLFGSVAHGAARPDSDLDLLVEVRGPAEHSLLSDLSRELEELLGCRVDIVPEKQLVAMLRPAVLASAIPLDRPLPYIPPAPPDAVFKDDRLYIDHILKSIGRVEEIAAEGRDAFMSRELLQDAALHNLQTMAESTQKLSREAKARHPHIDWKELSKFRNRIAHGYFDVNLEIVWSVIENELPVLKTAVAEMDSRSRNG